MAFNNTYYMEIKGEEEQYILRSFGTVNVKTEENILNMLSIFHHLSKKILGITEKLEDVRNLDEK